MYRLRQADSFIAKPPASGAGAPPVPTFERERMGMDLSNRDRHRYLAAAVGVGRWYQACQNSRRHPWGGVHDSADLGRCIYEYYPTTGWCRGHGVWAQALAVMGLSALADRTGDGSFAEAAALGAG